MKTIGRTLVVLVLLAVATGCDTRVYRTTEGVGVLGPSGGWFVCDDETQCYGTPG